ncbi:MAG: hypothetical protein ABIY71_02760, partial [Flavobacteriales bacterium]
DAPVAFYLDCERKATVSLRGPITPSGRVYVLVAPSHGQTPEGVLLDNELRRAELPTLDMLHGWDRLELFGTP